MGLMLTPGVTGNLNYGQGMPTMPSPMSLVGSIGSFGQAGGGYAPPLTGPAGGPSNIAVPGASAPGPAQVGPGGYGSGFMGPVRPGGAATGNAQTPGDEQGWFQKMGGLEGFGSITKGLGDLASIWGAIQGVGMARDQLRFDKSSYATNLANQTQSYNTTLEDRTRQRFAFEGKSSNQADKYLASHSL